MPKISKVKRVRQEQMQRFRRNNRKFQQNIENSDQGLESGVDPVSPKHIPKNQLGRSALLEINRNSELQNLVPLQPSTNPVTNVTYEELRLQPNEVMINMVHNEESQELSEMKCPDSDCQDELMVTTEKEESFNEKHVGRRIVNLSYFTKELLSLCNHGPLGCSANDIILTGEKQLGLISKFTFKCKMCNTDFVVNNDNCEENSLNLNACAVAGTVAIGCGSSQLEELLTAMDLPSLTENVYDSNHNLISKHWEKVLVQNMQKAGIREKEMAIAEGKITKEGHGDVDVIVDGCWSKRSYKKNYSALSGAAAIIGRKTGQILYLGIKNKYCQVCATTPENQEPKEHICFKNYSGPSTGMESTILVEGFKKSVEQHGLVYGRLISDGDASTHSKILEARPYPNKTVEKIECRNHLLRNLCNKLQALATETKYLLKHRKCVTKKTILAIRCTVIKAIQKHKIDSDVELLFDDILRCHTHAFGDHSRCKAYFCTKVGEVDNEKVTNDFFTSALWQRINFIVQGVAAHSRSLIQDVDSNRVENFHSVVAKFVGGKRINFSKKNSYQLRVHAAAVSFNEKKSISRLYKSLNGGKSPTGKIKRLEEKKIKKNLQNKLKKRPRKRLFKSSGQTDAEYGEGCVKPDVDEETFLKLKETFLKNLRKTDEEIDKIQKNTILQSDSGEWLELRRSLLTASNFGKIIKRRNDTSCVNTVKELLYKGNLDHVASIKHGRENERKALIQLSGQINEKIERCGLFIDKELPFLGATPDGLCGDDTIIEIKCPITAHKMGLEEALKQKKVTFWKVNKNGEQGINKTHNWYYQIQGQLHITERKKCIFALWTSENEPLKIELIERDNNFWQQEMQEKLTKFYMDCLLPELVDPRHTRNLQIRDPAYITDSIEKKKTKQSNEKSVN